MYSYFLSWGVASVITFFVLYLFCINCGCCHNDDIIKITRRTKMSGIINTIAAIIEAIANLGAGTVSIGIAYEPELPEELRR